MKKTLLHVQVGSDSWIPTQKEINAIANKFRRGLRQAGPHHIPVVVTPIGVYATVIEADAASDVVATKG